MSKAPLTKKLGITIDAAAATADKSTAVGVSPFAGTVTGINYTAVAAVTGAATDTRTLTLVNKGTDGSGTTVIGTLALASGVNLVAFDEKAFTLSAVAHATEVATGDVLAFVSTHGGSSGLADPGGLVSATITRTP